MIVSMLSMPEGTLARGHVSEARERLATSRFLFVDVELPEDGAPDEPPLAHLLGLEADDLAWLGRKGKPPARRSSGRAARSSCPRSTRTGSSTSTPW